MITFPEFHGRTAFFSAPIYIKEKWNLNIKIIYLYFKVIGYNKDGRLVYTYVMIEPNKYYTIANDDNFEWYFRENECHTFNLITKERYDKEFNKVLNKLK